MRSFIYHGGGPGKSGFSASNANITTANKYTLNFGGVAPISTNSFIRPPRNGSFASDGMGYGIGVNSHIKEFVVVYSRFTSNNPVAECTLQLRHLTADGTRTVQLTTAAQGTLLNSLATVFPNSSSANRYFLADQNINLNIAIVAGEMLFIVCSQRTVLSVNGVVCHVVLEEDY